MEKNKKKWPNKAQFKWQHTVVLTREQGAMFDAIISKFDCSNASQLCKKIATRELELIENSKNDQLNGVKL